VCSAGVVTVGEGMWCAGGRKAEGGRVGRAAWHVRGGGEGEGRQAGAEWVWWHGGEVGVAVLHMGVVCHAR